MLVGGGGKRGGQGPAVPVILPPGSGFTGVAWCPPHGCRSHLLMDDREEWEGRGGALLGAGGCTAWYPSPWHSGWFSGCWMMPPNWVLDDAPKLTAGRDRSRPLKDGWCWGTGGGVDAPGLQSLGWWAVVAAAGAAEPGCCQAWQGPPWCCHVAAGLVVIILIIAF